MRSASLFLLLAASLSACSSPSEPGTPASDSGLIVARDQRISIGGPPTIHVKDSPDDACGVIYLVSPSTRILRRTLSGRIVPASLSELTVGRRVGVWATVVLTSCPGQSAADVIQIVDVP